MMNEFNDSKSEIKVAECGRYKAPLIASNVGCYDETIINGKTGYLIDPDAPRTEWVRLLSKCVRNPKHVREMGNNLHEVTEEYFDINKVAKHRLGLYEECFKLLKDRHKTATYNKEWTFGGNS
jgi:glycosyltransferase involved in cell wall biosynthesis